MSFRCDLSSLDSTINFMAQYLNIESTEVIKFLSEQEEYPYSFDEVIDEFIERYDIDIEKLNPEEIVFDGVHITTNNDRCESIKKYGLLNLQQALMVDTPLRRVFRQYGLEFDFKLNKVFYTEQSSQRQIFEIETFFNERNAEKIIGKLKGINNYPINAFMRLNDFTGYGGNVHEIPEIVRDMADTIDDNIRKTWVKPESKCAGYAIKFQVPFSLCNFSHWYNSSTEEFYDAQEGYEIFNRQLLRICMEVYLQNLDQIFLFLKPDASVPFSDIYEFIEIKSNESIYSKSKKCETYTKYNV